MILHFKKGLLGLTIITSFFVIGCGNPEIEYNNCKEEKLKLKIIDVNNTFNLKARITNDRKIVLIKVGEFKRLKNYIKSLKKQINFYKFEIKKYNTYNTKD